MARPTRPSWPSSGADVLAPDGQIDRRRLGAAGLRRSGRAGAAGSDRASGGRRGDPGPGRGVDAPLVVIEAIKLLEAGLSRALCDQVWVAPARPSSSWRGWRPSRGMTGRRGRAPAGGPDAAGRRWSPRPTVSSTRAARWPRPHLQVLAAWAELGLPLPPADDPAGHGGRCGGHRRRCSNSVVREGGLTVLDRTFTPKRKRAFLRGPAAAGRRDAWRCSAAWSSASSVVEPYATYTHAMDHVASAGHLRAAGVRGAGSGPCAGRTPPLPMPGQAGFSKLVITVRADNPGAQAFYAGLGFQPCGRLARQAFVDGRYVDELLYELFL